MSMRTTLSIDEDVAVLLKRVQQHRNLRLKETVNEALRRGLREMAAPAQPAPTFQTRSVDLGELRIGGIDNIADVLAVAEGEGFR